MRLLALFIAACAVSVTSAQVVQIPDKPIAGPDSFETRHRQKGNLLLQTVHDALSENDYVWAQFIDNRILPVGVSN